ncbi:transmembrane 14C domain-containing protein [Trichophyton tonsurans CBS 112818]|uniref:Transmembrane protein 14C n=2 Tax=Trichophyton TaxID=5550 RepID=F2Q0X0_TRIEC|nr:transmembrane 14C domain-containing protein [Trichophyton tonsurans CBS 112818]EGE07788.1 transmembrane protein 14C [Trichophyton equinum CBS 127.97]
MITSRAGNKQQVGNHTSLVGIRSYRGGIAEASQTKAFTLNSRAIMNANTSYSAAALSLLTSCGGIIGYARTGSVPSIVAGLTIGALYAVSYFRLQAHQPYGEEIGLLASAVLGGSSIPRVIKTGGKPLPVGLSILATYGLVAFGLAYRDKKTSA